RTAQTATPVANAVLSGIVPNIIQWWAAKGGLNKAVFLEGTHGTMLVLKRLTTFIATSLPVMIPGVALAQLGQPEPWQLALQKGARPVMDDIIWFHDFLLWVINAIALFVLALLVIVMVKFNARTNPVPSRTTHNTAIEVLWTVVPVLILVTIAVPSFRLL